MSTYNHSQNANENNTGFAIVNHPINHYNRNIFSFMDLYYLLWSCIIFYGVVLSFMDLISYKYLFPLH